MAFWRYGKDRRVVASDFSHQRGMRRIDVLFCADDRQEYFDLLSQSVTHDVRSKAGLISVPA